MGFRAITHRLYLLHVLHLLAVVGILARGARAGSAPSSGIVVEDLVLLSELRNGDLWIPIFESAPQHSPTPARLPSSGGGFTVYSGLRGDKNGTSLYDNKSVRLKDNNVTITPRFVFLFYTLSQTGCPAPDAFSGPPEPISQAKVTWTSCHKRLLSIRLSSALQFLLV